ncbi:MAG TPA: HAMP domain-containing sensor histidine kinase [Devosia sp.]|nr:HAMP domain-containing sensor histidine kinase [Devosia sp.]
MPIWHNVTNGLNTLSMNAEWTTSPNARRVLQHAQDARPAWLWSQDGQRLIWSNPAAALFLAKLKKSGLKLAPLAVPLKGQVARTIRLGSPGRTSLARIQFNAGDKPASATCATTPLLLEGEEAYLLIVSVDPIDPEILAASEALRDSAAEEVLGLEEPGMPAPAATEAIEAAAEAESQPEDEHLGAQTAIAADDAYTRELHDWQDADPETVYAPAGEPMVFTDEANASDIDEEDEPVKAEPASPEPNEERPLFRSLSALVDRLAADEDLYTPLNEADDEAPQPIVAEDPGQSDEIAPRLFKITGRGFRPTAAPQAAEARPENDALFPAGTEPEAAQDLVERVSRYNFDELSRILNDRVGLQGTSAPNTPAAAEDSSEKTGGSLVNLGGETLVLNRLPLGILVFRDQQILFANRAITEMVGYDSVESLRLAGLTAIFPGSNGEQDAGPVNHLVQRDGTLVPVTARLQSTSWQGRPALMLSASATEVRTGHEDAVRAFAQAFAELRGDGFVELSRTGVIRLADSSASAALGGGSSILGKPLSALISSEDGFALRGFLERPGRFAETERPAIILRSLDNKSEIVLFAQGQAGIVSGYFAMVRPRNIAPRRALGAPDADPALLARIGRGVRRPLNTIIGFAELLRSKAFGELGDERYEAYAEDIAAAGNDIAALVDELEDYARLREGKYLAERASLDLTELLETCVLRIRNQANAGRIIVRNAISETLPRVTADRASLAQAVLNLLASAIDQSPLGSTVVISAQLLDDGGIAIHVRDSSNHAVDMAERFVVFRDGVSKTGQALSPVRSSVGLALTRSLLAVNAVSLSVDPAGENGVLFSLRIPADLVDNLPAD